MVCLFWTLWDSYCMLANLFSDMSSKSVWSGFDAKSHANTLCASSLNNTILTHVEDSWLFFPLELNSWNHQKYCAVGLADLKNRLQHAEATDGLEDLCHHLCTCSFTNRFKITNVMGQINNTCSKETQHCIDDKVSHSQLQYNCVHTALLALRGWGDWKKVLQVLERSDVKALNERQMMENEKDDILWVHMWGGGTTDNLDDERANADPLGSGILATAMKIWMIC